jgi:hypothetical protein|tara:strand:- start:18 stop:302 length:285 start_codon:yes stop_codon:yes gene_type:complete
MTKLLEIKLDLMHKMQSRADHMQDKFDDWMLYSDDIEHDCWYEDTKRAEIAGYRKAVNDLEKILQEKIDDEDQKNQIRLKLDKLNPKLFNPALK